jgi:hypothetical protein
MKCPLGVLKEKREMFGIDTVEPPLSIKKPG